MPYYACRVRPRLQRTLTIINNVLPIARDEMLSKLATSLFFLEDDLAFLSHLPIADQGG